MAKVLIIEDDPLIQRMYQKIFTFENYEVQVASNGEEGLEKVKTSQPDAILLDVMMPVMNGLEVLDKLKSDPKLKPVPVIMLTNLADEKDAETALSRGAVKYIIKSDYDPKQVLDMVKEILAGNNLGEHPAVPSPKS